MWSYHATNLLIHILAGLTLFGIMRRTLERWSELPSTRSSAPSNERVGGNPLHLIPAFAVALIWTVHPLQTESVTYIAQRAESLMGLFYLLTLYGFIRSVERLEVGRPVPGAPVSSPELQSEGAPGTGRPTSICFAVFSVVFCQLGMATKEVMVSAPLIVLLYDRTFIAGTFREAWRRRRGYYLGLAATWLVLFGLAWGAGNRGRTVGFGLGVTSWDYALTQFQAIAHYLRLSVWPHPLIFDYGEQGVKRPSEVLWDALLVTGLVVGGAWALAAKFRISNFEFRNLHALGFACAWFFLILAPTSIIPLIRQPIAEHRMYLPLAAVIAAVVVGFYRLFAGLTPWLAIALVCGCLTFHRNEDYRSKVALYRDTAAKRPANVLAHYNLGMALAESGRREEAIAEFGEALRLEPEFPQAYFNRGNALSSLGRINEAAGDYAAALRINPNYAEAHYNLGDVLLRLGRKKEARWHFNAAVLIKPDFSAARARLQAIDQP